MSVTVEEGALDPGLAICDAHHHLWDRPGNTYLAADYLHDARASHRIVSSVYVDCQTMYRVYGPDALRPVGETEFVARIANAIGADASMPRMAAGIVGFADLALGKAVGEVLDAHLAITSRFKGIRYCAAWDASGSIFNAPNNPREHVLLDTKFQAGFAELSKRELSFDAWVYHPQIGEVTRLARKFPDTTIILDHLGGPLGIGPYAGKPDEIYAIWKQQMAELARCANVVVKLGGIQMPLNGWGFHKRPAKPDSGLVAELTRHYYLSALDLFGTARCMFESNYPADRPSVTYSALWNVFKRIVANASPAEKAALFHNNAARVYRLAAT